MLAQPAEQKVLDIFDFSSKPTNQKKRLLKRKLSEVICGRRSFLRVYSKVLRSDVWFINEGLMNPADKNFEGKIITMQVLANAMADQQSLIETIRQLLGEEPNQ